MLVEIGIVYGIYSLDVRFVFVIGTLRESARDEAKILKLSVDETNAKHENIKGNVGIFVDHDPFLFFIQFDHLGV